MAKQSRWEGKASSRLLINTTPQEAWSLLEDFYTIHKWLPGIDTCCKVDGVEGHVRYCSTALPAPPGGGEVVKWCYEKLLEIDPIRKCLSYEILENNIGFKSYKSIIEVVSVNDGNGCLIQWSFLADPVEGLSYDGLVAYLDYSLRGMADRMDQDRI